MRRALLLPLLAGCKQVFGLDEPAQQQGDAAVDTLEVDASPDAPPPPSCIERWMAGTPTFSPPTLVTELSTAVLESDPSITADGLTLYFQRNADVYVTRRPTVSQPWAVPVIEPMFSSGSSETKISMSIDQTRVYIGSARPGGTGAMDIWRGRRDRITDPWVVDQTLLPNVNTAANEHDPHINQDWRRLYLAVPVNTQSIAVASRADMVGNFGAPVLIPELDRPGSEADPSLTDDERVIVFASTLNGQRRIVYSTRATATGTFATPQELASLNANLGLGDSDPMISGDGCTLYWSSTRTGNGDLYVTQLQ